MRLYAKDNKQQKPEKQVQGPWHLLPDPRLELSAMSNERVVNNRLDQRPGWRDPGTFRGAMMAAIIGGLVVAAVLWVAPHLWTYLLSRL